MFYFDVQFSIKHYSIIKSGWLNFLFCILKCGCAKNKIKSEYFEIISNAIEIYKYIIIIS